MGIVYGATPDTIKDIVPYNYSLFHNVLIGSDFVLDLTIDHSLVIKVISGIPLHN